MIEEAYVSFEVAKLLKEKGFVGQYHMYYIEDGKYKCDDLHDIKDYAKSVAQFDYLHKTKVPAPTQQMAMRWLREKHNISIEINTFWNGSDDEPYKFSKYTYGFRVDTPNFTDRYRKSEFDTYEQAAEAAIRYSLKNLI